MQYDISPGEFETVSDVSIGSFTLNEPTLIKLDGNYPFLMSDVVLKQGAVTIPPASYTLSQDTNATTQESAYSGKTLYGRITITNATYAGAELNISGSNFGTYSSNQGTQDFVNTEVASLRADTVPLIETIFQQGVLQWDATESYYEFISFVQDEGMIWVSTTGDGGTPNVNNKPSTNQDKWTPLSAPTVSDDITATGTYTVGYRDYVLTSDTSLGDLTITLSDGLFKGQKVKIIGDGTGFTNVTYTGKLSTGNNVISDGLSLDLEWDGVKWIAVNVVTADYVSGSFNVQLWASNRMRQTVEANATNTVPANSFIQLSTSQTYPIAFLTVDRNYAGLTAIDSRITVGAGGLSSASDELTETGQIVAVNGTSSGTTSGFIRADLTREGTY